jgi:hypothetical protein
MAVPNKISKPSKFKRVLKIIARFLNRIIGTINEENVR